MASATLLAALRRRIARIEGAAVGRGSAEPHALAGASAPVNPSSSARWTSRSRVLPLGVPDLDAAFAGAGLPCTGTHEIGAHAGDNAAPLVLRLR